MQFRNDLETFLTEHVSGSKFLHDDPVIHSMHINARLLLMTSFGIGMTSHAGGVFPTLSTALETACYVLIKDEALS